MKINKKFAYHKPSEASVKTMNELREAYSTLLNTIEEKVVIGEGGRGAGGAELTLAIRELEKSSFWLNKAINLADPEAVVVV